MLFSRELWSNVCFWNVMGIRCSCRCFMIFNVLTFAQICSLEFRQSPFSIIIVRVARLFEIFFDAFPSPVLRLLQEIFIGFVCGEMSLNANLLSEMLAS